LDFLDCAAIIKELISQNGSERANKEYSSEIIFIE
jgi:hypothetical protein